MTEKAKPKKTAEEAVAGAKAVAPSGAELTTAASGLAKAANDPEASQDFKAFAGRAAQELALVATQGTQAREQALQRAFGGLGAYT